MPILGTEKRVRLASPHVRSRAWASLVTDQRAGILDKLTEPRAPTVSGGPMDGVPRRWFLILCAAIAVAGIGAGLSLPVHHDTAWLAYTAGRVLDGARLYVDVIETNPPLIVWLFLPVVRLARLLSAWEADVYNGAVAVAAVMSAFVSIRLLESLWPDRPSGRAALGLVVIYILLGEATLSFGQREHLMLITTLPYLLLAALRAQHARRRGGRDLDGEPAPIGGGLALALGIAAGVGFALKPYFLPVWIAIEAGVFAAMRSRAWRRPETAGVAGVMVTYLAAVAILTPAYFTLIGWAATVYSAYHTTGPLAVARSAETWWVAGALAFAIALPATLAGRWIRRIIALTLIGLWLAAVLQGKGWTYHWFPVHAVTLLLFCATAIDSAMFLRLPALLRTRYVATRGLRALGLAALAVALLLATNAKRETGQRLWVAMSGRGYHLPLMIDAVEKYAGAGPIFIFSTNMQAGFPLVNYTGVAWGSRFNSLWPLVGLYPYRAPSTEPFPYRARDAMSRAEGILFEAVVDDLERNQPTLIVVDKAPPGWQLYGFDYLEYFGRDPRFSALIARYHVALDHERFLFLQASARP